MKYLILIPLLIAGCAGMPGFSGNFGGMTAEQIAAAVKDKSSGATCLQIAAPGGSVVAFSMNTDKGSITNGSATMKCGTAEATFTDAKVKP